MAEVSVVIACYNGSGVITKALDSALEQSFQDIEVIVVDDGSSDNSVEVVETYPGGGRVRLIQHGKNRGISAARNTAIQVAEGVFIGFLDQDDLWRPDRLATALEVFAEDKERKVGLVFGNEETRDLQTGALMSGRLPPPDGVNMLQKSKFLCALLQRNFIPTAAALFRRSCFDELGLLDEGIKSGIDDFDMFIRVARRFDIRHVDVVQAVRHVHSNNFTKLGRMIPEALEILDRLSAEEPAVSKIAPKVRSHYFYLLSREQYYSGEYLSALGSIWHATRWNPSDPKCWFALLQTLSGPVGRSRSRVTALNVPNQVQD